MNSFLELHSDIDYRNNQREYYASTWEYITAASDFLIPFQWECDEADTELAITAIFSDDSESIITGRFFSGSLLVTGWTLTGTGTWTIVGPTFECGATVVNDFITSNTFTLTENQLTRFTVDTGQYTGLANWTITILQGVSTVYNKADWSGWDGNIDFTPTVTAADYTVKIFTDSVETVTTTIVPVLGSTIYNSGDFYWYDGSQLTGLLADGVFYLKLEQGTCLFYSDWIDVCGFTNKTKVKISSSFDYGGVKYVDGYAQWTYKDATVRRAPRAEIEIVGDRLNGKIEEEKKTASVRYTLKMKVTEAEWEALVHGVGGTFEITDNVGKVYNAVNVELSDPEWHRSNGIVEMTFVDENNISVWSRNNSSL